MTQVRNPELVRNLAPDFYRRGEAYTSWGLATAGLMSLPGLKGLWLMSGAGGGGAVRDYSGMDRSMVLNGDPDLSMNLLTSYAIFDGTGDYFNVADNADHDILGNESFIDPSYRGLSMGCWAYHDALGSAEGLIAKWQTGGNQRSYQLRKLATDDIRFSVSTDGTAEVDIDSSDTVSAIDTWYFAAGVFDVTAGEMRCYIDRESATLAAGVPATINNSTSDLEIGRSSSSLITGRIGMVWLSQMALPDHVIQSIYGLTAPLFGK